MKLRARRQDPAASTPGTKAALASRVLRAGGPATAGRVVGQRWGTRAVTGLLLVCLACGPVALLGGAGGRGAPVAAPAVVAPDVDGQAAAQELACGWW